MSDLHGTGMPWVIMVSQSFPNPSYTHKPYFTGKYSVGPKGTLSVDSHNKLNGMLLCSLCNILFSQWFHQLRVVSCPRCALTLFLESGSCFLAHHVKANGKIQIMQVEPAWKLSASIFSVLSTQDRQLCGSWNTTGQRLWLFSWTSPLREEPHAQCALAGHYI